MLQWWWRVSGSAALEPFPCTHLLTLSTTLDRPRVPVFQVFVMARPGIEGGACSTNCTYHIAGQANIATFQKRAPRRRFLTAWSLDCFQRPTLRPRIDAMAGCSSTFNRLGNGQLYRMLNLSERFTRCSLHHRLMHVSSMLRVKRVSFLRLDPKQPTDVRAS